MRIDIRGTRLFFDVEGAALRAEGPALRERPTVILVHGGPGLDHSRFKPHHSALAEVAQVVYLDLRGHGRSDRDIPERWTLAQWAEDLHSFCDALGIVKPIVLGASVGGCVAMKYAARYPDHPGKLILVTTMARFRLDPVLAAFERLGGREARDAARAFWESPSAETLPAYLERCLPVMTRRPPAPEALQRAMLNFDPMFHFARGEIKSFDLGPELARIRCPALVIAGAEDPITPPETSEEIFAALPAGLARLVRFAGCGHEIVSDDPQGYFRQVKEFIAER